MSSAAGVRCVALGGLVLMLTAVACSGANVTTVTATEGKPAVLPCTCPDQPPYLVWQRAVGEEQLVVNCYGQDEVQVAAEYQNRTELKLKLSEDSCSLYFYSVRPADQGTYTCYYRTKPLLHERVYLEVTEQEPQPSLHQSAAVTSSVCVFLVIAIAVAAVYVGVTCRKRQQL